LSAAAATLTPGCNGALAGIASGAAEGPLWVGLSRSLPYGRNCNSEARARQVVHAAASDLPQAATYAGLTYNFEQIFGEPVIYSRTADVPTLRRVNYERRETCMPNLPERARAYLEALEADKGRSACSVR
jgi:hypothetical protein